MWIRHLPADYYKQQSDFDNLVCKHPTPILAV